MPWKPAALAALLLLPAAAGAQPPAGGEVFTDTLDVTATAVEVFVADRDGQPVPGLTQADFQVLEDGRPVEVTEVTPGSSRPLALAVFFDSTSLDGSSRTAALRALGGFLAGLSPGDRVLFAGFDGSLTIRSEAAGDPQALTAALEGFGKLAPRGALAAQERAAVLREIREAPSVSDEQSPAAATAQASNVLARLREYIQTRAGETRAALGSLQQTLEALASLPGRRTLLYVGGGLPMRPGAGLYSAWESRFSTVAVELAASALETSRNDATPLVREVADRAAATGSTFFALALSDAGGAAESAGRSGGRDSEDSIRSLQTLAGLTGGRVMAESSNPIASLEMIGWDLGGAYTVVYAPPSGETGERPRIQVTARGGALAVRVRPERVRTAPVEPLARRAMAALTSPGGENPLKAALTFEDESPEEGGRYRVTATVALPLTSVFVQPQEHFHAAHLTLAVVARDGQGRITAIPRAEVPIEIPNERLLSAPGQSAGYRFILHLAPGETVVAVALRDDTSGVESVTRSVYIAGPVPSR